MVCGTDVQAPDTRHICVTGETHSPHAGAGVSTGEVIRRLHEHIRTRRIKITQMITAEL